ncbi:ABC-type transport auxiliary lipoprotein family protein [Yoonia sp.]|uniref:ABC-type transport auxiliary lipoprotein family protein n=1 Tax=Yoonia sp. TaxID=2212373 RepID=UPI0025ECE5C4|nr:ABC-type transport auxiliary lipoprotein family protein [Yoonia sp.]
MTQPRLTRRMTLLGALCLPGCTALTTLNQAAIPRDTYDLAPAPPTGQGPRTSRTLLVLEPSAAAAIATDRILIKPDVLSVTYLPQARWSDDAPLMVQSLLVRSLSAAGQFGYVGAAGSGPVPDVVLLTRIDQFGVDVLADGGFQANIALQLTVLRDRDQRIVGSRRFQGAMPVTDDSATNIVRVFQQITNIILAEAVIWVGSTAARS